MNVEFEAHRDYLQGVAYRMLGSVAEAEDVVQDAFLRWQRAERIEVQTPRAFLTRIVTRLCLDQLKSARARRESYVGTWLPEPVVDAGGATLAHDLSFALLLALERLSPPERAAFILHDVFELPFDEIAGILERDPAACRQLAVRARAHVRQARPRFTPEPDTGARLLDAFQLALASGDVSALSALLATDAVLYSDGGGKKLAALNPIFGRDHITRFMYGVASKRAPLTPHMIERTRLNGMHAFVLRSDEGLETVAFETAADLIVAVYVVRNPDKLGHLH